MRIAKIANATTISIRLDADKYEVIRQIARERAARECSALSAPELIREVLDEKFFKQEEAT